jgi:hypothetical protein
MLGMPAMAGGLDESDESRAAPSVISTAFGVVYCPLTRDWITGVHHCAAAIGCGARLA